MYWQGNDKRDEVRTMLEKLREELHMYINSYGPTDPRTVNKSQELDKEIVKDMQKGMVK